MSLTRYAVTLKWVGGILGAFLLVGVSGCSGGSNTKANGPSSAVERREDAGYSAKLRIRPRANGQPEIDKTATAPFWSPDHDEHEQKGGSSLRPPANREKTTIEKLVDAAKEAASEGMEADVDIDVRPQMEGSASSSGGSLRTNSPEVALGTEMETQPTALQPLGSGKPSGSKDGAESSFRLTAELTKEPVMMYAFAAFFFGLAAFLFWLKRSLWLSGAVAMCGVAFLVFATAPVIGAWGFIGIMAVGAVMLIPAASKWGAQSKAASLLVNGIESVSDVGNPDAPGSVLKAALKKHIPKETRDFINKALVDPAKASKA